MNPLIVIMALAMAPAVSNGFARFAYALILPTMRSDLVFWSEGMIWSSPERHGSMTGIIKSQIDWIPLSLGGVRPTQGKTLAVMQVSGGQPELQHGEPAAHSGALDAAADHTQPVICRAGVG